MTMPPINIWKNEDGDEQRVDLSENEVKEDFNDDENEKHFLPPF